MNNIDPAGSFVGLGSHSIFRNSDRVCIRYFAQFKPKIGVTYHHKYTHINFFRAMTAVAELMAVLV